MKTKWRIIAPLAITAVGALAAGVVTLLQKLPKADAPAADGAAAKAPAVPLNTGSYSFVSGFQDAATVELLLDYDPVLFTFSVVEEDFLNYSSDSHVALVEGPEFRLQLEYASYYHGEDFAALSSELREKYKNGGSLRCGGLEGVWVLDGDNILMSFPIPGDAHSYLLITAQKTPDFDDEVTALVTYEPLTALLSSIRFERR